MPDGREPRRATAASPVSLYRAESADYIPPNRQGTGFSTKMNVELREELGQLTIAKAVVPLANRRRGNGCGNASPGGPTSSIEPSRLTTS
jgi:hypothetical protein